MPASAMRSRDAAPRLAPDGRPADPEVAAVQPDPILRRLRQELERLYGDRLERVILYGSRARGDARPDSDYDVAVVLRDYDGNFDEIHRLADLRYELMLDTGAFVCARPFAPEDLTKRTLFMDNLRREGTAL